MPRTGWAREVLGFAGAFLLYLALGACLLMPHLLAPGVVLGGYDGDAHEMVDGFWWYGRELSAGRLPYRTDLLGFPEGGVHFYPDPVGAMLAWPFTGLLGLPAAYNLSCLLRIAFSAAAGWFLVRSMTRMGAAALVAGLIYGFSPLVFGELRSGVTHSLAGGSLAFALWAMDRAFRHPRPGRLLAAGALSAFTFVASAGYYGFMLAPASLVLLARCRLPAALRGWLWWAVLTTLFLSPFALGVLWTLQATDSLSPGRGFLSFAVILEQLRFADPTLWLRPGKQPLGPGVEHSHVTYLGLASVILAMLGATSGRRLLARTWIAMAAVFLVLSLGSFVVFGGVLRHVDGHFLPLPFHLAYLVPLPVLLNFPHRFLMPVHLSMGVLAGLGLHRFLVGRTRVRQAVLGGLAAAAVLLDLVVLSPNPFPLEAFAAPSPEFHREVAAESRRTGERYPILDLFPELTKFTGGKRFLLLQSVHGQPIPYRISESFPPQLLEVPLLRALWRTLYTADRFPDLSPAEVRESLERLQRMGFAYVVLHEGTGSPSDVDLFRRLLQEAWGPPRKSGGLWIFSLRDGPGGGELHAEEADHRLSPAQAAPEGEPGVPAP